MAADKTDDTFELYDLRVEVICPPGERILCGGKPGDYFTLEGELLYLPPGQGFSIYSLGGDPSGPLFNVSGLKCVQGAVLPLLAAKQRETHPNDWMSTDADVACPDPHCKSLLRITRTGKRRFSHDAVTVVPLTR
jgi:uncharacterized repeat protein (TIGR04076 family)